MMKSLINKLFCRETITYIIFGILTTAVNYLVYYLFYKFTNIDPVIYNIIAWIISVLFAFITNKKYVFKGTSTSAKAFVREIAYFYGSRLFSGIADVLIMSLFVDVLGWNEVFSKVTDEILVSAFNFLFSFLVIFKEKKDVSIDN